MTGHLKRRSGAPPGFFATEAAGLRWLAEPGAVPVVAVLDQGEDFLRLERLRPVRLTVETAREFGGRLARLHNTGAEAFGWAPAPVAWFGPLTAPFEVPTASHSDFATFWAHDRLTPMVERIAPWLDTSGGRLIDEAIDAVATGVFGAPHLAEILTGYEGKYPMPAGWRHDLPAHLFFALLAHVHLFGAGYLPETLDTARRIIDRARALAG